MMKFWPDTCLSLFEDQDFPLIDGLLQQMTLVLFIHKSMMLASIMHSLWSGASSFTLLTHLYEELAHSAHSPLKELTNSSHASTKSSFTLLIHLHEELVHFALTPLTHLNEELIHFNHSPAWKARSLCSPSAHMAPRRARSLISKKSSFTPLTRLSEELIHSDHSPPSRVCSLTCAKSFFSLLTLLHESKLISTSSLKCQSQNLRFYVSQSN